MDKAVIKRELYKIALKLYDHRSDIAFGVGVIGSIAGAALIGKSSYKQAEINKEHAKEKEEIEKIDAPEEEKAEAFKVLNRKTVKKTIKNYAVGVGVEVAAIGANGYAYASKSSQYSRLLIGYQALSALYEGVRARVIADQGEDKWYEYEHGIDRVEVGDLDNVDDKGNPVVKEVDEYAQAIGRHTYVFDSSNDHFRPSRGANDAFIAGALQQITKRCELQGYLDEASAVEAFGYKLLQPVEVNGKTIKLIHCINPNSGWVWNDKNGGKNHVPLVTIVRRTGEGEDEKILLKFNCVDNFRQYL